MDTDASVEVVVALGSELAEGPIWDDRTGRLVWVDILGRRVHATDPETGETSSIETPLHVGAVAARAAGGFVAALEDGFWILGDGPPRRITAVPRPSRDSASTMASAIPRAASGRGRWPTT